MAQAPLPNHMLSSPPSRSSQAHYLDSESPSLGSCLGPYCLPAWKPSPPTMAIIRRCSALGLNIQATRGYKSSIFGETVNTHYNVEIHSADVAGHFALPKPRVYLSRTWPRDPDSGVVQMNGPKKNAILWMRDAPDSALSPLLPPPVVVEEKVIGQSNPGDPRTLNQTHISITRC